MSEEIPDPVEQSRQCIAATVQKMAAKAMPGLSGSRVLVVGGTGRIGGAMVRLLHEANRLRGDGVPPLEITSMSRKGLDIPLEGVRDLKASIGDVGPFSDAVRNADYVVYAVGPTSDYRRHVMDVIKTQMVGVQIALNTLRSDATLVYVSSTRVFGRFPAFIPIDETTPAVAAVSHPDNLYDSAKRMAESLCLEKSQRTSQRIFSARLANVYATGPERRRAPTVVESMIREARSTGKITIRGHEGSIRNHLSDQDAAAGLLAVLMHGTHPAYILGGYDECTTRALADQIAETLGVPVEVEPSTDSDHPSIHRFCLNRAENQLGFQAQLRLADVLPYVASLDP